MIAYAQSPTENSVSTPPETTITSNTELVQVPVVIRKGREHVSGLTQADFTVLDGGRRQKLAFVKTTDAGVVLRHVAGENVFSNQIDTAGETPRVTVIVVDSANIPFCRSAAGARFVAQVPGQRRGQPWADSGGGFPGVGCACGARFHLRPNVLAAVADYGYGKKNNPGASGDVLDPGLANQANAKQQAILGILPRDTYDLSHGGDDHDLEAKNFSFESELRGLNMLAQSLAGVPGTQDPHLANRKFSVRSRQP